MEGFMDTKDTVRRYLVRILPKNNAPTRVPGHPYITDGISPESRQKIEVFQLPDKLFIYQAPDSAIAEMAAAVRHTPFATDRDSRAKTLSLYFNVRGLSSLVKLGVPCGVVELPEESQEGEDTDSPITPTAGEEPILNARIPLLGIR